MTQPLVSVIVPFMNHRSYLPAAVENMHCQSYSNWEMLLVDNNATDGSRDIALALARAHPDRVRYVHQPVQGIPFARNKGLTEARGRYVSFLDVDDQFAPNKLADQVPILEANPEVAMVFGLTRRIYLADGREVIQDPGVAQDGVNAPPRLAVDWLTGLYHLPQTGATLVRTEVARRVGGFDEGLLLGNDDVAYHLKLAFDYPIWFMPEEAVLYYRHPASEGARLNRERGVQERYLNARTSWIMPYAVAYEQRTGNGMPRYWAERSLAGSLARFVHQHPWAARRRVLGEMVSRQRRKGHLGSAHYRVLFLLHAWLPFRWAAIAWQAYTGLLAAIAPSRYPATPSLEASSQ